MGVLDGWMIHTATAGNIYVVFGNAHTRTRTRSYKLIKNTSIEECTRDGQTESDEWMVNIHASI